MSRIDWLSELSLIAPIDGTGCAFECEPEEEKCKPSHMGYAGLIIWFTIMFYLMAGQFVICEEFFVPVLSDLGNRLKMPDDVQGATLLAVGSSSPELFTALIGAIFLTDDNPGPGTNVGSAVFNMCCIIGLSAIAAPRPAKLVPGPLFRDSIFYFIGLFIMFSLIQFITAFQIEVWEAIVITAWWIIYVVFVIYWEKMEPAICERCCCCCPASQQYIQKAQSKVGKESLLDEDGYAAPDMQIELKETDTANVEMTNQNGMSPNTGSSKPPQFKKSKKSMFHSGHAAGQQFTAKKDTLVCGIDFTDEYSSNPNPYAPKLDNFNHQNVHVVGANNVQNQDQFGEDVQQLLEKLNGQAKNNINGGFVVVVQPGKQGQINDLTKVFARRRTLMETVEHEKAVADHIAQNGGDENDPHTDHESHGGFGAILHKILKPWALCFNVVIPAPESECTQKYIFVTILLTVFWLGLLTFFVVDCAVKIGECLSIPGDLLGITLLAVGSSLPDCIASVIVAKQMKLDMAVANAFGSNIFDVHLCVGFAYVVGMIVNAVKGKEVTVELKHNPNFAALLATAAAFNLFYWLQMWCTGLRLQKWVGVSLLVIYVGFLVVFTMLYLQTANKEKEELHHAKEHAEQPEKTEPNNEDTSTTTSPTNPTNSPV